MKPIELKLNEFFDRSNPPNTLSYTRIMSAAFTIDSYCSFCINAAVDSNPSIHQRGTASGATQADVYEFCVLLLVAGYKAGHQECACKALRDGFLEEPSIFDCNPCNIHKEFATMVVTQPDLAIAYADWVRSYNQDESMFTMDDLFNHTGGVWVNPAWQNITVEVYDLLLKHCQQSFDLSEDSADIYGIIPLAIAGNHAVLSHVIHIAGPLSDSARNEIIQQSNLLSKEKDLRTFEILRNAGLIDTVPA